MSLICTATLYQNAMHDLKEKTTRTLTQEVEKTPMEDDKATELAVTAPS